MPQTTEPVHSSLHATTREKPTCHSEEPTCRSEDLTQPKINIFFLILLKKKKFTAASLGLSVPMRELGLRRRRDPGEDAAELGSEAQSADSHAAAPAPQVTASSGDFYVCLISNFSKRASISGANPLPLPLLGACAARFLPGKEAAARAMTVDGVDAGDGLSSGAADRGSRTKLGASG